MKGSISDRVPDKHKDLAQEKSERLKTFLNEEYLPKDRRDQFIFRGKKVCSNSPNAAYNKDLWCLCRLSWSARITTITRSLFAGSSPPLRSMQCMARTQRAPVRSTLEVLLRLAFLVYSRPPQTSWLIQLSQDPAVSKSFEDIRVVLERFANGKSMSMIKHAIDAIVDDTRRDEGLRAWWKSVDGYVRKVLLEPGYVLEPDCNRQANILRDNGRQFFDDKYRDHFDNLFGSVAEWAKGWKEDPVCVPYIYLMIG